MKTSFWTRAMDAFMVRLSPEDALASRQKRFAKQEAAMASELERLSMRSGESMLDARAQSSLQLAFQRSYSLRFYAGSNYGVGIYAVGETKDVTSLMTVYIHTLDHSSPHLYLDNKRNNHLFRHNFPEKISKAQLVPCEGYISSRYDLYAPKGYKLDALVIGAPDVLDACDRLNLGGDVEVLGNQLYIVFPYDVKLSGMLPQLVQNGQELAKAIDDNLSRYHDDRSSVSGRVSLGGQRIIRK